MHQDFIDVLLGFARRNNLYFSYDYNETLRSWSFRFRVKNSCIAFGQHISQDIFDSYAGNTVDFAHRMIDEMKSEYPSLC